ncbi:M43 family zinc metalloprotease [Belliella sp. R4-6]|uniref:M43 family zinc metalloprotease n=1 Tax=Belliella alkalica TaxID=1730871 RepID=A0ABS9VEB8_9BACT|nr:M43 family zinc metalloprotease [Belliella alkalica]MCH7414295.1 M43 family zinc metalloprotease [Belliella alkalica]
MNRIFLKLWIRLGLSFSFIFLSVNVFSQSFFGQPYNHIHDEKCASVHIEKIQEEALGIYGSREYFESWMSGKIEYNSKRPAIQQRLQNESRVIPVVVHVIHNGTGIGQGTNIPQSQIDAQIRTLNEDFRRQNADQNQTPAEFLSVAADANIEFVLAKVDPNGFPTTGVVRVQGTKSIYGIDDAAVISSISSWPPEDYLNIWVVPLSQPFIGYATFPISDLPGLNFAPSPVEFDGITVDYRYFGEGGSAVSSSRGRTATHEVGHYLGLRHIWGDANTGQDGCLVDDFVDDTPNQDADNNNCRINNPRFSCGSRDMTENYMDYSPDACMNLFTQGQVDRINVVLEFSPRRASLINNFATREPILADLDLSIEEIINPRDLICSNNIVPQITLLNRGINNINSARIQILLNDNIIETRDLTITLSTAESIDISFNTLTLAGDGQTEFKARIVQVNGGIDDNITNNELTTVPILQPEINLPFTLDLSESGNDWIIRNPDNSFTWERTTLPISGVNQNLLFIRHYEYESPGQLDFFISPSINLTNFPNAQLTFNLAHAPFENPSLSDILYVAVSTDCGNTFDIINPPYSKDRTFLQTSTPTLNEFIPTSNAQFRREILNLSAFSDFDNVRIAFITRNGYGNNIYLKDVEILSEETFNYKLDLNQLISPGPINNGSQQSEVIQLTNSGNLPVNGFLITRSTNGGNEQIFIARGQNIAVGTSTTIELPNSIVNTGVSRLEYFIENPNFDQNFGNSSNTTQFTVKNEATIRSPWRQNFDGTVSFLPWSAINVKTNTNTWKLTSLQSGSQNNAIVLESQDSRESNWFGSPMFDLSTSRQASIFYDLGAANQTENTVFKIMISQDGGVTYNEISRKTGSQINTVESVDFNPNTRENFRREFVNLSEYSGSGNTNVRVAFVVENGSQNNGDVFLDNIELFLSANEDPVDPGLGNTVIFPNPARDIFNIAFNFATYETVNIQIFSLTGALVQDIDYPNTLNQTYSFSSQLFSKGVFIVKITSNSITETRKLIIH